MAWTIGGLEFGVALCMMFEIGGVFCGRGRGRGRGWDGNGRL